MLTHSVQIIIAVGLILIYKFLLKTERVVQYHHATTPHSPMRRMKWWVMGHESRKMTHFHDFPSLVQTPPGRRPPSWSLSKVIFHATIRLFPVEKYRRIEKVGHGVEPRPSCYYLKISSTAVLTLNFDLIAAGHLCKISQKSDLYSFRDIRTSIERTNRLTSQPTNFAWAHQ